LLIGAWHKQTELTSRRPLVTRLVIPFPTDAVSAAAAAAGCGCVTMEKDRLERKLVFMRCLHAGRHHRHSQTTKVRHTSSRLVVPRYNRYGCRTFSVAGPATCFSLRVYTTHHCPMLTVSAANSKHFVFLSLLIFKLQLLYVGVAEF